MRTFIVLFLLFLISLPGYCGGSKEINGYVFDTKVYTRRELKSCLDEYRIIYVGESHYLSSNREYFKWFMDIYPAAIVCMEYLPSNRQEIINEYIRHSGENSRSYFSWFFQNLDREDEYKEVVIKCREQKKRLVGLDLSLKTRHKAGMRDIFALRNRHMAEIISREYILQKKKILCLSGARHLGNNGIPDIVEKILFDRKVSWVKILLVPDMQDSEMMFYGHTFHRQQIYTRILSELLTKVKVKEIAIRFDSRTFLLFNVDLADEMDKEFGYSMVLSSSTIEVQHNNIEEFKKFCLMDTDFKNILGLEKYSWNYPMGYEKDEALKEFVKEYGKNICSYLQDLEKKGILLSDRKNKILRLIKRMAKLLKKLESAEPGSKLPLRKSLKLLQRIDDEIMEYIELIAPVINRHIYRLYWESQNSIQESEE